MEYPDGFSAYARAQRRLGAKPDVQLARFAARYRLAGQISSIELLGFSAASSESYTVAMRIALAYSAVEILEAKIGKNKLAVLDAKLAEKFKSHKLEATLAYLEGESNPSLKKQLAKFRKSKGDSNVSPVIRAIRHSMFHGQFTPTAAGLEVRYRRQALIELELALFKSLNDASAKYFSSRA